MFDYRKEDKATIKQEIVVGTDVWYHLTITTNNGDLSTYVNGVKRQFTRSVAGPRSLWKNIVVYSGVCIDELLLSEHTLSTAEIGELYHSYLPGTNVDSLNITLVVCEGPFNFIVIIER